MKKWCFIFALLLSFTLWAESATNQVVLMSRTRSGRNWYQYSMYRLTGKRVCFIMPQRLAHMQSARKTFWCSHGTNTGYGLNQEKNKLILTLRNYKELFAREARDYQEEERIETLLNPQLYKEYVEFIQHFDKWNVSTRYLYYYEDMMDATEETLRNLLVFTEEPLDRLPEFMDNIDRHRQTSINFYDKRVKYSITHGKDNFYHTRDLPKDILLKMDEMMKEHAGDLFDRYLKRYETEV